MRTFLKFNRGLLKLPVPVKLWMLLLVSFNLVWPLFYIDHLEAQVVLASMLASMILMTVLTGITGFTRILGLAHILWLPLLPFLWTRLDQIPAVDGFGIWVRGLIAVNFIALVFDAVDVFRYISGNRAEMVEGL